MDMLKRAWTLVRTSWWGPVAAYVVLFIGGYRGVWELIEPAGLPESFGTLPWPLKHRIFYHLVLVHVLALHVLLVAWLWGRWRDRHTIASAASTRRVSKIAIGELERDEVAQKTEPLNHDQKEIAALRNELSAYESLEQEILGLLAPGDAYQLNEIPSLLGIQYQPESHRRVRLAIAKLQAAGEIEGTGGALPKIRRPVSL